MTAGNEKEKMACPYCKSRGYAVRSTTVSELVREITYECGNPICKARWVGIIQAVRVIKRPEFNPDNPLLPMSVKRQKWESRKERS